FATSAEHCNVTAFYTRTVFHNLCRGGGSAPPVGVLQLGCVLQSQWDIAMPLHFAVELRSATSVGAVALLRPKANQHSKAANIV
ncbi:MAG: hypothetical protein RR271_07335, partial [Oscillospiraceae bacterium]